MERESLSPKFKLGSQLPHFKLKNIDGKSVDSSSLPASRGVLIVFTCNHCPYVKGSEAMLIEIAKRYQAEGLSTLTINSNDPVKYPDDSYENMVKKGSELNLPYPYLFDETQEVARLFDAACTPEAYLFNAQKKLVYHGSINDSHKDARGVKNAFLRTAVEQLLAGKSVEPAYVNPIGCSIKWK